MRKKEKFIVNGLIIGLTIAALIEILSQRKKTIKGGGQFYLKDIDINKLLKSSLVGGALGGLSGFGIHDLVRSLEKRESFSQESFLKEVLADNDLRKAPSVLKETVENKKRIEETISREFKNQLLVKPFVGGSFGRRTAISTDFDVDLIVPFKKNAFVSTAQMFEELGDYLKREFTKPDYRVTKLSKGFQVEYHGGTGDIIYFDVIPGKERSDFYKDGQLTLYKRAKNFFSTSSTFKAVPRIHRDFTKNQPKARKVIKLLKVWKNEKSAYFPSIALENLVIESFEKGYCSESISLSENLVNSMYYISTMIESYKVKDRANSNNSLCDGMSHSDRVSISKSLRKDSEFISKNPINIKEIFPE